MFNLTNAMRAFLLSAALIAPACAQDILDRNGVPMERDDASPIQYILPDTVSTLGQRRLSFDTKLSEIIHTQVATAVDHFRAKRGGALVMDVNTGEILAMVSVENFGAHPESNGVPFNIVTQGLYEVGISAKAITVATGLEDKVINTGSVIDVRKPIHYDVFTIDDYNPARAKLKLIDVIVRASNIGRVKIEQKLGPDEFANSLRKYGQFSQLSVEGLQTAEPLVPARWNELSAMTVSYGHGLATTPLQAGLVMAAMANGGYLVPPTIFKIDAKEVVRQPIMSEATSAFMRLAMQKNMVKGTGTSLNYPNIKIGGLSGTANKSLNGKYDEDKVVTQFTAVFPIDKPKYLVFTTLDEPQPLNETHGFQTSGWNAAPLAGKIIKEAMVGYY